MRHDVGDGRRFGVTASHLTKVANFNLPHLPLAPPFGVIPFEFCRDLRRQKTRVPGLWWGILCMFLRLAISVEHRLVVDKQTGRHTTMAYAYTALAWRCAVKTVRCATIVLWYYPTLYFTTIFVPSPPVGGGVRRWSGPALLLSAVCVLKHQLYEWQQKRNVLAVIKACGEGHTRSYRLGLILFNWWK